MTTLRLVSKDRYTAAELAQMAHREIAGMELVAVEILDLGGNMQAVKPVLDPGFSFFRDALTATEQENPAEVFGFGEMFGIDDPTQVITNSRRFHGAIALLYPSVQKRLRDIFGDAFCVLPSSVHEVLALPLWMVDPKDLPGMVRSVNAAEVPKGERLADTAFLARFNEAGEMTLEDVKIATSCTAGCTNHGEAL